MTPPKANHFLEYQGKPIVQNVYESGRTLRYHANPYMGRFNQTDADHQWGCAALILTLFPYCRLELVKAAIFHDAGERWAGDLPYPVKVANPDMADAHALVEHQMSERAGIPQYTLTSNEQYVLKFVDRVESHLFTAIHNPTVLKTGGFRQQETIIMTMAKVLEVQDQLASCFSDILGEGLFTQPTEP
jgi:hypothetical protein